MEDNKLREIWENEEKAFFEGWDFSYIKNRWITEKPDWNYDNLAKDLIKNSKSVLDMETGGGERFSTFGPFPKKVVATEGYKPNIAIAKKNLEPLGVKIVEVLDASKLPFEDEEFDLIINRHGSFNAKEVFRILKKGGIFLTQQVSGDYAEDLIKKFNTKRKFADWNIEKAKIELEQAEFKIELFRDWKGKMKFSDVGAIVYFLNAIPWTVPGFSVKRDFDNLKKLQKYLDNGNQLEFKQAMFLIKCKK